MPDPAPAFARAALALDLLALDPGLGGLVLRARAGPVRDRMTGRLPRLGRLVRLHPQTGDEALYGGLDLSGTLSAGRVVRTRGLLEAPAGLVLTMAERCQPRLAARLALCLDEGEGHVLIAMDEGAAPDETCPPALAERLAFSVDLQDVSLSESLVEDGADLPAARSRLEGVALPEGLPRQLAELSLAFGIDSQRAPLFALRAARALAALSGRNRVEAGDVEVACQLTFPHRATQTPAPPEEQEPPAEQDRSAQGGTEAESPDIPDEMLMEAVRALLPDDLLERLAARKSRAGRGSGTGSPRKGNRRGRPLPSRSGRPGDGSRVDVVATLRAAAPWQTIRRQASPERKGLHIRRSDILVRRYEERSDRLLIFTVDASGSAALARLAEAKGAIELLLARAYARRDHVSLVAFRGRSAELLLPPTRSLVQTKRRLADLPGGGGTPLACGLEAAMAQADAARRRGLTPTVCLLTDGRANVTLDGRADRAQAGRDAERLAAMLPAGGVDSLVIDTGRRPERSLERLAAILRAPYLPLPRADAERLSGLVSSALGS